MFEVEYDDIGCLYLVSKTTFEHGFKYKIFIDAIDLKEWHNRDGFHVAAYLVPLTSCMNSDAIDFVSTLVDKDKFNYFDRVSVGVKAFLKEHTFELTNLPDKLSEREEVWSAINTFLKDWYHDDTKKDYVEIFALNTPNAPIKITDEVIEFWDGVNESLNNLFCNDTKLDYVKMFSLNSSKTMKSEKGYAEVWLAIQKINWLQEYIQNDVLIPKVTQTSPDWIKLQSHIN